VTAPSARALLRRFGAFADQFAGCFSRQPQRMAASQYLEALFNDSERKSMQAMHGRLSDPISYQALQHFITDSPWEAQPVWAHVRTQVPVRTGILALDDTSFPKQGKQSVGVKRQYCGALGKVANCQVAVSTVLIADALAWPLTFELYLPNEWCADAARRTKAGIPDRVRFREKWRIALSHIRQVIKDGFQLAAVVADADYGSTAAFRGGLERQGLRYGVAIRGFLTMWTPGARRTRTASVIAAAIPDTQWQRVCWGRAPKARWLPASPRFACVRPRVAGSGGSCASGP
jgi:SRSO17 transposase